MNAGLVQARGQRLARPQRRLIEADVHPEWEGRVVLPNPYDFVFTLQVRLRLLGLVVQGAME